MADTGNEPEKTAPTRVRFGLRTAFVLCTLLAIVLAVARDLPGLLWIISFVLAVVISNVVLNILGVYPRA